MDVQLSGFRQQLSPCDECTVRLSGFCGTLDGSSLSEQEQQGTPLHKIHDKARARESIYHAGEKSDDVIVICNGWASRYNLLSDGRRQILSFMIPGDLVSLASMFKDTQSYSVQALTDVGYCRLHRPDLKTMIAAESKAFEGLANLCVAEQEQCDERVADLGRRLAHERLARFILQLMDRLSLRGMVHDHSFAFPLRQQHIADAMGLTPIHVSRVIGMFRKAGLIEISKGVLKIFNLAGLRRIGNMK